MRYNSVTDLPPKHQREAREQLYANKTDSVAQVTKHQPDPCYDTVGPTEGAGDLPGFALVVIESFRVRLLDERNIWDKYLVDGLVKAGLIRDDSPQWCKVHVAQFTTARHLERTEITITYP